MTTTIGQQVSVSGHISDIRFVKYDIRYCYFTLHCEDSAGIKATIPCRIRDMESIDTFKKQGIEPGAYVLISGHTDMHDHSSGRNYWVDVVGVTAGVMGAGFIKPVVDYRLAKNKLWFKALNTQIADRIRGVNSKADV